MPDDEVPSNREVSIHLERMLLTPRFKNAAIQSKILRFVVDSALASLPITEVDIAAELSSNFDADSHKVRSSCTLVRGKIKDYYEVDGRDDLVQIEFPPGPAYKPTFAYNTNAEAVRAYKRGLAYQALATPQALNHSTFAFLEAIGHDRNFAPTYAAAAETGLLNLIMSHVLNLATPSNAFVKVVESDLRNALALNPRSWRGHIIAGALKFLCFDWASANAFFDMALEIDPVRTKASLWYASFLTTTGREEEGLAICRAEIADYPENAGAHLVTAFLLYAARRYDDAHTCLANGFRVDWDGDLQNVLIALIFTETGTGDFGQKFLARVSKARWSYAEPYIERHPGLMMQCLARGGQIDMLQERLANMRRERRRPLQFALGYLAMGDRARAIGSLMRAARERDILLNWLHVLPVFDSLRTHPRYERLLNHIRKWRSGPGLK